MTKRNDLPTSNALFPTGDVSHNVSDLKSDVGFIFHDFEKSKITGVRQAINRKPLELSAIYFLVVAFWTVVMTYGSVRLGANPAILNLTPHVALFCLILGVFAYPARFLWIPILAFVPIFAFPFFEPSLLAFSLNPSVTLKVGLYFFALNLGAGLAIAMIMRMAFRYFESRQKPYDTDLNTTRTAFLAFGIICMLQAFIALAYAEGLSPKIQEELGLSEDTFSLITLRVLRGCVVVTAFLLALLEFPSKKQFLLGVAVAPIFVGIGILEINGIHIFPMVDVAAIAILIALKLPTPSAIVACILGIPVYSAITGHFLNDPSSTDQFEFTLSQVSIILLILLIVTLGTRSRNDNERQSLDASSRRLNRIRQYAGVGMFSVNVTTGRYRLDAASAALFDCEANGHLYDLLDRVVPADREKVRRVLNTTATHGETLVAALENGTNGPRSAEIFLWSERTNTNNRAAFGLVIDITSETLRNQELEQALAELRLKDEKQRQLFSIVSHELRTPASVISLLLEDVEECETGKALPQLKNASNQLLAILGDMKQAVNPEKNMAVIRKPYVPKELADFVKMALGPVADEAKAILELHIAPEACIRRNGDLVRNRQIVSNLVRNALLHSGGTKVTLAWKLVVNDKGSFSHWEVEDNGRGINAAEVERLFEPFERGKDDLRRSADGSGLGLFIARSMARSLGGDLWHETVASGGARFVVCLPEDQAPQDDHTSTSDAAPQIAPRDLDILIAEDNPAVSAVMEARFRRHFDKVRIVENGVRLLRAVQDDQPDVIVTDLFMPELDGDEAARSLRKDGFDGPIIGLTAAAIGEEADRFASAGVDLVLYKPVDMSAIHEFLSDRFPERRQSSA